MAGKSTSAPVAAPKEKAKKEGRIAHPGVGGKTGFPFETVPTDFSFSKHKGLNKKAFKDATGFMEYRAAQFAYRGARMLEIAKKLADKAKLERQFGSEYLRKKARKYASMQAEMENIRKLLAEQGIDPSKLNPDASAPVAGAPAVV